MTTVEQHTCYLKGTCYTKSGDKTSFEQDQWHGFSKDGYSSSVYVPLENTIRYASWYTDSSGNHVDIDDKYLTFDHNCKIYHEIIEEPSSSSYEYKVAASTVGYDELCEKVAEYARNNVASLSGYPMSKLTNSTLEGLDSSYTFHFSFLDSSWWDAITYYGNDYKGFYSYNVICNEDYYIKKDETS